MAVELILCIGSCGSRLKTMLPLQYGFARRHSALIQLKAKSEKGFHVGASWPTVVRKTYSWKQSAPPGSSTAYRLFFSSHLISLISAGRNLSSELVL